MLRAFPEHRIRLTMSLNGLWDFVAESADVQASKPPETYAQQLGVPGAWETCPGLESFRGRAWYRTRIDVPECAAMRFVFGGVSHTGTVFVDGAKVGMHYDAFTPWDVIQSGVSAGEHELAVRVDNTFGEHSALHVENDYYTYGGITRPVAMEALPAVFIDKLFAVPEPNGGSWDLTIRVRLKNVTDSEETRQLTLALGDHLLDIGDVAVAPNDTVEVTGRLCELGVDAWTAKTPRLYDLVALLHDDTGAVDDLIERIGFREVRVEGKKLLLNGQPIRLRGYNRHEDHPQFGNALPIQAMLTDLQIMCDLGCNFIRTCHYPNDMRFLDLCDELGMYVWEESHARTVDFKHPRFRDQIETSTREMLEWHWNHPSIITWGCLNECESYTEAGMEEHKRVLAQIKTTDPSRPITFASNRQQKDLCLGLVDIVSWNHYIGWYGGGIDAIEEHLEGMLAWLHSDASHGGAGKPVILSEFGGGAIYGNRQRCRSKWSEEYQSDLLDESLRVYLNHPDVIGVAIWQFCDVRITQNWKAWSGRPRTMNNKGTVDEYRRPKLAYDTVKRRMGES